MRFPRDLSGEALVKNLCRTWGYSKVHQVGSHAILETDDPSHQRIAIPLHRSLRVGTLNNILRDIARHKDISRDEILSSL